MRTILGVIGIAVLVLTGCSTASEEPTTTDTVAGTSTTSTAPAGAPLDRLPSDARMIAIGDSYTQGTSILVDGSWPYQFAASLEGRIAELDVIAGDGWNSKRLDREARRAWDGSTYDLVFVGVGANDVVLPFGLDNYVEGLDALGRTVDSVASDDATVVVMSIPDFRASPWGRERIDRDYDIEAYNEVLAVFADRIGAVYIDVTTVSGTTVGDPSAFAPDGLHFSTTHYAEWVELMLESLS